MTGTSSEMDTERASRRRHLQVEAERLRANALRADWSLSELEQNLRRSSATGRRAKKALASVREAFAKSESIWVPVLNREQMTLWRLQGALESQKQNGREHPESHGRFLERLGESADLMSRAVLGLAEALQLTKQLAEFPLDGEVPKALALMAQRRERLLECVELSRQSESRETEALEELGPDEGPPPNWTVEPDEATGASEAGPDPIGSADDSLKSLDSIEVGLARLRTDIQSERERIARYVEERITRLCEEHSSELAGQQEKLESLTRERDEALASRARSEEALAARNLEIEAERESLAGEKNALDETVREAHQERDKALDLVESLLVRLKGRASKGGDEAEASS